MKPIYSYFYIIMLSTALVHCNQDDFPITGPEKTQPTLPEENSEKQYVVNKEGALVFATLDAYARLTDSLVRLNDEAFNQWENNNNFHSLRSFVDSLLNEAVEPVSGASIRPGLNSLLQVNKKYLILDEDSLLQPLVGSQLYRNVINKEGIFYIGNVKHQVDACFVTITSKEGKEQKIKKIPYRIDPATTRGETGNVISYPTIYGYGYSGAIPKHRISTWFRIYKNVAVGPTGNKIENIYMDIMAESAVKMTFFWINDKNKFTIKNLQIHMPGLGLNFFPDENGEFIAKQDEMWYLAPSTSANCTRSTTTHGLTNGYMGQQFDFFLQDPVCVHYEVSTPYARVRYDTYHPLPEMDKNQCGHEKDR